ncbi:MAG: DegT/DnrJ/EryC1/StrS family aminotransferase [Bacteroidales bacterium]|nr:DegT/DnrJ/EryC1/StrS family aminotransferase [Bacteroidales bacterium]
MLNAIFNNIVIGAAEELTPFISISPIDKNQLFTNLSKETPNADKYLRNRFGDKYLICTKAREGLYIALKELKLSSDDVVTILTTSSNYYISSCVTNTIESVCKWSRELTSRTKVILVNHEFGYAYSNLSRVREYGLPIIEDCAHSFYTQSEDIGKVGDYVIYSLPKAFSMQLGAVLVYRDKVNHEPLDNVDQYVRSLLDVQVCHISEYVTKRMANYRYFLDELGNIGISPVFELKKGDVPGVFMFQFDQPVDYQQLKFFMRSNGVDSSVFYGKDAFFVPIHQNLSCSELSYICSLIRYFAKEQYGRV